MNFEITYDFWYYMYFDFCDSLVHTWLLEFHFSLFCNDYNDISWLPHYHMMTLDMSLSLITRTNSDWWHGISPVVTWIPLVCLFLHVASIRWFHHPPKVLWCDGVFGVLWSSIFKCVLYSLDASLICSLFSVFLMCDFHDVSEIPTSSITHDKKQLSWKYPILPCFMHIFCSFLFSVLERDKKGF